MKCKLCEMDISSKPYYSFKAGSIFHKSGDDCRDALLKHVKILEKTIRHIDETCKELIDIVDKEIIRKETQWQRN